MARFKKGQKPWNTGKKLTKEHRLKLSLAKKGKIPPCTYTRRNYVGKNNPAYGKNYCPDEKHWNWKGEDVGYDALHDWIKRKLGQPTKCEECGKDGLTRHKIHWANVDHEYKRDLKDWLRLCSSCHRKYDLKNGLCKH